MSERLDLDLEGELPDDGPDTPVGEWDDDLLEDFPADDPAARPRDAAGPGAAKKNPAEDTKADAKDPAPVRDDAARTQVPTRRSTRGNGAATGLFFAVLMLLAGLTIGAGVLTAAGGIPESLWNFSGFGDPLTLGDFRTHPVNAFWFALGVTILAAVLAAVGITRRQRELREQIEFKDAVLSAVYALDPDVPESWRQPELLADPDLAAVTGNMLGHYHLQQAKLTRYVGLEGELHRLEKAMAEDCQVDLQGNWENPAAGSLADQALRLLAARDESVQEASRLQQTYTDRGPDLVAGLRDARSWQVAVVDQIHNQGAAAERLSRQLGKLAAMLPQDDDRSRRYDRLVQALAAIRDEVSSLPGRAGDREQGTQNSLNALIERASRLAFQIAMEVARLGAKGERLLPLTQDLEELTTELRSKVDRGKAQPGQDDPRERALETIRGRLGELDPQVLQATVTPELPRALGELAPAAGEASAGLAKLSQSFGLQTTRLQQLSEMAAALTGLPLDDVGNPEAPPGSGMLVERLDPFGGGALPEGGLMADPFASSSGSIFDGSAADSGEFARTVPPGEQEALFARPTPRPAAQPEPPSAACPAAEPSLLDLRLEPVSDAAEPQAPPPEPPASPQPESDLAVDLLAGLQLVPAVEKLDETALSSSDEKIYDLSEFDAQPLPPDPDGDRPADLVYDLSEFDAVRIA